MKQVAAYVAAASALVAAAFAFIDGSTRAGVFAVLAAVIVVSVSVVRGRE